MAQRRRLVLVLAATLGIVIYLWRKNEGVGSAASTASVPIRVAPPASAVGELVTRPAEQGESGTARVASEIESVFEQAEGRESSGRTAIERDAGQWPEDWRMPVHGMMLEVLLNGRTVKPWHLARWSTLNPRDSVLGESERLEWVALTTAVRAKIAEVSNRWISLLVEERVDAVRSGAVAPYKPQTSDEYEAAVQRYLTGMAKAGVKVDEVDARAAISHATPPPAELSGMSFDGQFYLLRDFPALPRSRAAFEELRFLVSQELIGYSRWFESRGVEVDHRALDAALQEVASRTMESIF